MKNVFSKRDRLIKSVIVFTVAAMAVLMVWLLSFIIDWGLEKDSIDKFLAIKLSDIDVRDFLILAAIVLCFWKH